MAEEDNVIGCDYIRNWSELGIDLLELILKRLALVDLVRFKLVSSNWNKAAKSYISGPFYKPVVTPWLMLPRERGDLDAGRFFSLLEKRVYTLRNLFEGFGEHERFLLGSSYGWLVMWDSKVYRVHLLNPISRVRIILPSIGYPLLRRVFLSSDPSCNATFYVVVLYGKKADMKFAFHKHGDNGSNSTGWTDLDSVDGGLNRIFFHNSLLYGMSLDSKSISVWDFGATSPIKTMDFLPPERDEYYLQVYGRYLVESQGEVLFLERLRVLGSHQYYYEIHKLHFTANKVECLKVQCLQERSLVLSNYGSTSIPLSTLDIPELEANSIYVAKEEEHSLPDDQYELFAKVEAYNLENKGFESIFTSQVHRRIPYNESLLWIVPNPYKV